MKTNLITLLSLFLFLIGAKAQDRMSKFEELFSKQDTVKMKTYLNEWQEKASNDPEFYVAYYNYYLLKAKEEIVMLQKEYPKEGGFALTTTKTDSCDKEVKGYIYSKLHFCPEQLSKAYHYIDEGIKRFPQRLDMRYGKITMLLTTKDYDNCTKEIIEIISAPLSVRKHWLWSRNQPLDNSEEQMLSGIQNYLIQFFNLQTDDALRRVKTISTKVLEIYPNNIKNLSNLSIAYTYFKEYEKALPLMKKALKITPKDVIIINNMAYVYEAIKEYEKAKACYKLIVEYGNDQEKEWAQGKLKEK
jgi:tetratricopeptide (TPR) repeat protein